MCCLHLLLESNGWKLTQHILIAILNFQRHIIHSTKVMQHKEWC